MKQSELSKTLKREDGVDFINKLPDGVLVLILSCLPHTEEVVRSSILSRRWRYLWTSVPSLDIYCFRGSKREYNFKKSKFKEFVYWVLANRSADLNRFHLGCSNYYTMSTVARWIHLAVTKNVKELDLSFCPKENTKDIEFPHSLVTCGSLEDKDLIHSFLESCQLLESLILINCVMKKELDLFCISCPNLTFLKIENQGRKLMRGDIRISCPKLDCLVLRGRIAYNFYFECLHSLKEAIIEPDLKGNNVSFVLFPGISHVESLSIDLYLF